LSVATGKEADGFIRLSGQEFPFLVLESGWSEPEKHLIEDARLWLWGTNSVNFVIVIQSVENALVEDPADGTIKLVDDCVQLQNPPEEENALQNAMKYHLIRLHQEGRLLLGSVVSTFYIYRRAKENDDTTKIVRSDRDPARDIYCQFEAEIYPHLPKREEKIGSPPKEFRARDRSRPFSLNLGQFHERRRERRKEGGGFNCLS